MQGWQYGKGLIYLRQWFSYKISLPQGQSYTERKERFTPLILRLKTKRLTSFALKRKANSQSKVNESSKGGYPHLYPTDSAIVISPVDNRRWIAGYPAFEQLGPDVKKTCECFRALLNLLNVFISPHVLRESWSGIQEIFVFGIWILGFGIQMQLKESGIPPTIGIRKPSSTYKEFGFTSWNPESKAVLDSLKWHVKSQPRSQSS